MPGMSCIRQTMQRCGKSGSHCHPRSRLGFTDDASTDISCNIMPPPAPHPPHHLSAIQCTCRHKIPLVFFFPNVTIFIFQTDQKNACRPCCGQPRGRSWKETWLSFTQTAWMNESQPDKTANRNVPWCQRLHSAVEWEKTLRHETKLAFNVNNVDPTSSVCAKRKVANLYQTHLFSL